MRIRTPLALALGLVTLLGVPEAWSANPQSVTANIRFDTPLTVTKNADVDFKSVLAGAASTVYRISTAAVVSVVSGPGSPGLGTPGAAHLTIAGAPTQAITISPGNPA